MKNPRRNKSPKLVRLGRKEDRTATAAAATEPDNPELTDADFARMRDAIAVMPELVRMVRAAPGPQSCKIAEICAVVTRRAPERKTCFAARGPGTLYPPPRFTAGVLLRPAPPTNGEKHQGSIVDEQQYFDGLRRAHRAAGCGRTAQPRSARRQHHPHAGDGCGREGEVRPPGNADGACAGRLYAVAGPAGVRL